MSIAKLKDVGGMAAGFVVMLAFLAIPIMFLMGAAEFSIWALDWIPGAIGIAILACLVIMPLAIIPATRGLRSEEHTSELQSLMRISYAVFCLKKKKNTTQ